MKITKRIWAWLLCLAMMAAIMPETVGFAASTSNNAQWIYTVTMKVRDDENECGTKNTVYGEVIAGDVTLQIKLGSCSRNEEKEVSGNSSIAPWEVTKFAIYNTGSDAVSIEYAYLEVAPIGNPSNKTEVGTYEKWDNKYNGKKWIETQSNSSHPARAYIWVSQASKIDGGISGIMSKLSGTYIMKEQNSGAASMTGSLTVTWDGKVSDQYLNSYNVFNYGTGPTTKVSIYAVGLYTDINKTSSKIYSSASTFGITTYNGATDKKVGFKVENKQNLLDAMNSLQVNCITITTEITFAARRTSETQWLSAAKTYTSTYTIIRNVFSVGEVTYSADYYSQPGYTDRNYYNVSDVGNPGTITVTVPIEYGSGNNAHFNDTKDAVLSLNNVYVAFKAKLLVSGSEEGGDAVYISSTENGATTNDKGKFKIKFNLKEGYDTGENGLKLVLTNVKTYLKESTTKSGTTFYLLDGTDISDKGNYTYYNGAYKVDTITPSATVAAASGTTALGTWSKTKTISFTGSEKIYYPTDSTYSNEEIIYSLTYKDGNTTKTMPIYDQKGGGSTTAETRVASSSDSTITLAIKDGNEGVYTMEMTGKDKANNTFKQTLENIYLDSKAPVVTMEEQDPVFDSNERLAKEYTFAISDLSETGKVYYYIDTQSLGTLPDTGSTQKQTGTISSLTDQWVFIEQTSKSSSGATDGSAVIYVDQGNDFSGTMYYYGIDNFGNTTDTQSVEISLTNYDITPVITSTASGYYKDYSITLSNQAGINMTYRWLTGSGTEIIGSTAAASGTVIDTSTVSGSWNGEYTLEVSTTSEGTTRTTSQKFTFDHEAPTLSVSLDDAESYSDIHYITVTSSDGGAGIETITGQYLRADGTTEGDEFTVDVDNYSYQEVYSFGADAASGAHRLKITAVDKNGLSTTETSNLIYIRNAAPEITLTASADNTYADTPIVEEGGDYSMTIKVHEDFVSAANSALSTANEQYIYYRASVNSGSANWIKAGALTAVTDADGNAADAFEGEITVENPTTLVAGENIIKVDVLIGAAGRSVYDDEVVEGDGGLGSNTARIATEYFINYCDDEAPEYIISLENDHTSEDIEGTLLIRDDYTEEFTFDLSDYITLTEVERATSSIEYEPDGTEADNTEDEEDEDLESEDELVSYTKYTVTVSDNTDGEIIIYDAVGNSTSVPITITNIDREGPATDQDAYEYEYVTVGDRTDAKLTLTMTDIASDNDALALAVIPAEEIDSAVDEDGVISGEYFGEYLDTVSVSTVSQTAGTYDGEVNTTYEIYLAGLDGDYYVGLYAEDSLENASYTVLDTMFSLVDAAAELTLSEVSPTQAYKQAKATLTSNVPVYVLPQNMITDTAADELDIDETNLELANNYAANFTQETSIVITGNGDYTFYVCDDLGRTSKLIVNIGEEYVTFGHEADVPTVETYVTTIYELYDENGDYADTVTTKELLADGEYAPTGNATAWGMPYEGYGYANETKYALIEVTAADGTYLWPIFDETQRVTYHDGLRFDEDESAPYLTEFGYTKMVYCAIRVWGDNYSIIDQPVRELPLYVCTETTYADGEDNWQQESVYVDNIDNTEPEISLSYDPMLYDPSTGDPNYTLGDVTIEVIMRDPESGMRNISLGAYNYELVESEYGYTYYTFKGITDDDVYYGISLVDNDGNPIDYMTDGPYTASNSDYDVEVYSDTDLRSTKVMRLTVHQNVSFEIEITSMTDLRNYPDTGEAEGLIIEDINKVELSESEYTLDYYYLDNEGLWQSADPDDEDTFFKTGKAVITPTESGDERGLYVLNNNNLWEKELNLFENSYTFKLKDKYSYTLDVDVGLTNFDETPGTLSYELDESSAQQAVLTVTAEDALSGVGSVTLTHGDSVETLDNYTAVNGVYTYTKTLTESGTYTLTLYDKVGNKTSKVFAVTSIDTVAPTVVDVSYSTTSLTTKTVTAKLNYSKSNVTITSVDYVQEGATFQYDVDYENSIIRFYANGTLEVKFVDSAGNIGYYNVSVSWITDVPPSLTAVAVPADDLQTVDVTFEKALDENYAPIDTERELSDITVLCSGVAQRADTALYTFRENGKYTFTVYDDEGTTSYITIEITDIDKSAPKITQISWSYSYDVLNDDGGWTTMELTDNWTVEDEAGYVIATDKYPITNYNVDVTIETDKETTIAGMTASELSTQYTLTYSDDGMYVFNVEKTNGMMSSYAFDVEVIDKVPPVIELNETDLIFYENPEMGQSYERSAIDNSFIAYDTFMGETTDLTSSVTIDYGNFDPSNIENNTFDRSKPYTITYSVTDSAHNTTEVRMTITLVALTDTIALVNGSLPNSANRIEIDSKEITVKLQNFSDVAYAKIDSGAVSMGEMKTAETVIPQATNEAGEKISGEFKYTVEKNGWYTILVQTDKRDYFNLQIYV